MAKSVPPTPATTTNHALPDRDAARIHRLFDAVYSHGRLDETSEVIASEYVGYCSGTNDTYHGPAGVKAHAAKLRGALFEFSITIEDLAATPQGFEATWTSRGRLERPIMGLDPSVDIGAPGEEPHGQYVEIPGHTTGRITDGKIHDTTTTWALDQLRHITPHPARGTT